MESGRLKRSGDISGELQSILSSCDCFTHQTLKVSILFLFAFYKLQISGMHKRYFDVCWMYLWIREPTIILVISISQHSYFQSLLALVLLLMLLLEFSPLSKHWVCNASSKKKEKSKTFYGYKIPLITKY